MARAANKKTPVRKTAAYLDSGRVNQKLRTRDALLTIAVDLIRKNRLVSVAQVADIAKVSRSTAYLYFPTRESLVAQAGIRLEGNLTTRRLEKKLKRLRSPEEKLDTAITVGDAMIAAHEPAFRSMLQGLLERKVSRRGPARPTIRLDWITQALTALRQELGEKRFQMLTAAISLFVGIEATIVLEEICRINRRDSRTMKRWAAQLLLRGAREEAAKANRPAKD